MTESEEERPQAESNERPAIERAEEMVDHLGERAEALASMAGLRIRKLAARAREEAEDVWAEAQNVRHRKQS